MTTDNHDHDHDHDHGELSHSAQPQYYEIMETAIRELLVEKKMIAADEIRRQIEVLDARLRWARMSWRVRGPIRHSSHG
jgi:ABC-type Zn2+ transport system substrate-binding protein/surface adhesin